MPSHQCQRNVTIIMEMIFIVNVQGYDIITNFYTGEQIAVQRSTGKIEEVEILPVVKGSYIITPEQQERDRELRELRKPIMQAKKITGYLGKYYALSLDNHFSELHPATVSRLVFLATFLKYKDDCLYRTKRTPLNRSDLVHVLGVSKSTADRFMAEVHPQYLREDSGGNLHMNTAIFSFGPAPKNMKKYQKIYMGAIRKLYRSTPPSNHKHLGYVFMLLPFLNIEQNILCHNPYTVDSEEMKPMTMHEFCEIVGLSTDRATIARLRRVYTNLTFDIDGQSQLFCHFLTYGEQHDRQKIYVNPRVMYSGSNYEHMRMLTAFMANPA